MADIHAPVVPAGNPAANGSFRPTARFELLVTVGILLALLMGALDNFVALTALPKILAEFKAPNSGTFVISAYVIATTASIPIFAKLSDLWSRRNVFIAGLVVFIIGSILSGVSQNLSELIAFRAIQGFGSGGFFPVGIAIVAVVFPPKTRARVIGGLSGVFGIAVVAGPLLGSTIVQYTTWRWVFYVNIPIGLAGLAIIAATLGPLRPEKVRRFDVAGAALLVSWVAAIMFPLYEIADNGWAWTDSRVIALLSIGIALIAIFVLWEHHNENPLVPVGLFRHRVIAAGGGTTFFIGTVFFPVATFLTLVVSFVLAPGSANASDTVRDILYFLVIPLVIGAATGGQLLTRVQYRVVALMGLVIGIVGMAGLTQLATTTPLWKFMDTVIPVGGIILPLMPLGFGIGLTFPVFLLAAQNEVKTEDVGEAGGLIQFLQSLGGAVGLSVLASYQATRLSEFDPIPTPACLSSTPPMPECATYLGTLQSSLVKSYDQVFMAMLGILIIAFVIALFIKGRLPKTRPAGAEVQMATTAVAERSNEPNRNAVKLEEQSDQNNHNPNLQ
ncbi:MAG: MFS transporter [Nitrososphaerota archaeon]|nr:MFS transporter [Nitrososphaerota archaeon]